MSRCDTGHLAAETWGASGHLMTTQFLCRCGHCHCPLVVAPSTWAQCVQWHRAESLIHLQWTWSRERISFLCGEGKSEIRGYLFISMACHLSWLRQSQIQPQQEDQLEQVWCTARCHSDLDLFLLHSTHLLSLWIVTSGAHRRGSTHGFHWHLRWEVERESFYCPSSKVNILTPEGLKKDISGVRCFIISKLLESRWLHFGVSVLLPQETQGCLSPEHSQLQLQMGALKISDHRTRMDNKM